MCVCVCVCIRFEIKKNVRFYFLEKGKDLSLFFFAEHFDWLRARLVVGAQKKYTCSVRRRRRRQRRVKVESDRLGVGGIQG